MKVLMITHGTFLNPNEIVAGNSVRAFYLCMGLLENKVDIVYLYPRDLGNNGIVHDSIKIMTYGNSREFFRIIDSEKPDILFVGYWELLSLIPDNYHLPVVVDVVAPRILEAQYQDDYQLEEEVDKMIRLYRKADFFICGSLRQKHFLLPWLLMAGFDCTKTVPAAVIPITANPGKPHTRRADNRKWKIVTGGVTWPWRNNTDYIKTVVNALASGVMDGELTLLQGSYIYAPEQEGCRKQEFLQSDVVNVKSLLPYKTMEELFSRQCDIGIELAQINIERQYSQSFRSVEFLRCGLPVIVNDYLELSRDIVAYDAGWVINTPEEITEVLKNISSHPDEWLQKSRNAIKLASEKFHYNKRIKPLLDFIQNPFKPHRNDHAFISHTKFCKTDETATEEPVKQPAPEESANHSLSEEVVNHSRSEELSNYPLSEETVSPPGDHQENIVCSTFKKNLNLRHLKRSLKTQILLPLRSNSIASKIKAFVFKLSQHTVAVASSPGNEINGVIVTRADIFPTDHGAAVKIERTASAMSHYMKCVYLVTDDPAQYGVFEKGNFRFEPFPDWIVNLAPDRESVQQRIEQMGVPSSDAFLYYPMADKSFIVRTLYLAWTKKIRWFQAEFPIYGRACLWGRNLFGGKAVVVEHNVEYSRLMDQFPEMKLSAYDWIKNLEIAICNASDAVITVSDNDRQILIADGVFEEKIHTIPHGVDLEAFRNARPIDIHDRFSIPHGKLILTYHGIFSYPPNREAIVMFAQEIIPRLKQRDVDVAVLAIGRMPPRDIQHKDIFYTGSVDDVAPYLLAADIAVVPLLQGGGTRMKILDYFAAGIPVISTSKGIEGINITNGIHALVCDDFDLMAEAVCDLRKNPQKRRQMVKNAMAFVEKLDWKNIAGAYLALH